MTDETNTDFRGYIQVYTGNGKGKTTAALGLALRAAGHGFRTYFGQFLKGRKYGELESVQKLAPLITLVQFGRSGFIHVTKNPDTADIQKAVEGLEECRKAMLSGEYRIIVLDEIHVAVYFNLVAEAALHRFLDDKPVDVEVILTGRYAPASVIERADLVTEMKDIRHYYDSGVQARDGIER
ncbi:MAG: cob(I)yrinic acid a,c-diamide adenosyltransferase [Acidobacteria bacterium]|nr:cob(I)yrinic acid a,c-diamide adenosyltransferase [Acidobacteriota bacterium]MBU1339380.1 cob(I)yrinic acid a,c-diamide adenosyltransferase [Acidobacteriota bacterium]MBU1475412.1 cob(I)yrinic acid a,c-diamide adenosyltransferase [Acidobacteriota bacterium]MBU4495119.1 cob(I)yrinic acid a,c-diamide adenosyltransferase [Acidobacteriota bacterium]